jgi:hypothetical protein
MVMFHLSICLFVGPTLILCHTVVLRQVPVCSLDPGWDPWQTMYLQQEVPGPQHLCCLC